MNYFKIETKQGCGFQIVFASVIIATINCSGQAGRVSSLKMLQEFY